jgi:hypothetical protein
MSSVFSLILCVVGLTMLIFDKDKSFWTGVLACIYAFGVFASAVALYVKLNAGG